LSSFQKFDNYIHPICLMAINNPRKFIPRGVICFFLKDEATTLTKLLI
jgi:hypothetical protein